MNGFTAHYANVDDSDKYAALGELVVPTFCIGSGPSTEFLGVESFLPSPGAVVSDVEDKDLDALCDGFVEHYPGLPEGMVRHHFVQSLVCAAKLKAGAEVSTEVNPDKATVLDRESQKQYTVWDGEDPASY